MSIIKHGPLGALNIKEPGAGELETRVDPELNEINIFLYPEDRPGEYAGLNKDEARALRQALSEFIGDESEGDRKIELVRRWWAQDVAAGYWSSGGTAKNLMYFIEHIFTTGRLPERETS